MRNLLLLFVLLLTGCSATASEPPPDLGPWRATLFSSGGASGGGGGVEIWSDGSVFQLNRDLPSGPRESKYLGQLSDQEVNRLAAQLAQARGVKQQEYANMTTSLAWFGEGGLNHHWSWGMGNTSIASVLKKIEAAFAVKGDSLKPGSPPQLLGSQGSAWVFLAIDGSFGLTLSTEDGKTYQARGKDAGDLKSLAGMTLPMKNGEVKIEQVELGWLSGKMTLNGEESSFRVPAWFEVAP